MALANRFIPSTASGVQTVSKGKVHVGHPLDPLTADEIPAVTLCVRQYIAAKTAVKAVRFMVCNLVPPPKKDVLAYLGIPLAPNAKPEPRPAKLTRRADVDLVDVIAGDAYNVLVAFIDDDWQVESFTKLPEGTQPQITPAELLAAEDAVRADERIRKLARDVGVEPEQIRADGWAIGYDDRFPKATRLQQALLFARFGEHENLYAHPLDFIPILDANTMKVIHIDFPAHYTTDKDGKPALSRDTSAPAPLSDDSLTSSKRERIPPPLERFDFLPDLQAEQPGFKMRDDIKPLHVLQPEGVSFKMDGHVLTWQKWSMHVAFTHREGTAISAITYNDDGVIRPIFYRLSLAEMVVPYAAPEFPHPRKMAFDVGEYGMGTMANELSLGCDCLGQIHYLPGSYVGHDGSAVKINNAICIHEEDAGVLWKHTDYRVNGRGHSVRSRRLVVSMICTLANYEYIWNYHFYQDGTIEFEMRLSGVLQVYAAAQGEQSPYGVTVAPRVNAHYHQHIFSVRVDPMIDGLANTVIESDVLPAPDATGSTANFAGNAFTVADKVIATADEGGRDYDWAADRRWRIVNPARTHYASGVPAGYAVMVRGAACRTLPRADGWAGTRASFTRHGLWVVREKEGPAGSRMWPSGTYVPHTREEPEESVGGWLKADGKQSLEKEDLLLYITVGTTHIPRPEDWPVMPVEHLRLMFKPQSFFRVNPSMDVPGVTDSHSKPAFSETSGQACCET